MARSTATMAALMASAAVAFTPSPLSSVRSSTSLKVAVDPTTVSKKDYEDICGVSFDEESLEQRLKRTSFLYPKHVEVIEDIAPIADKMVDDIVSTNHDEVNVLLMVSWCNVNTVEPSYYNKGPLMDRETTLDKERNSCYK